MWEITRKFTLFLVIILCWIHHLYLFGVPGHKILILAHNFYCSMLDFMQVKLKSCNMLYIWKWTIFNYIFYRKCDISTLWGVKVSVHRNHVLFLLVKVKLKSKMTAWTLFSTLVYIFLVSSSQYSTMRNRANNCLNWLIPINRITHQLNR